jgi:hypothetical protein
VRNHHTVKLANRTPKFRITHTNSLPAIYGVALSISHEYIETVDDPGVEEIIRALESARAEVNLRKSALEHANTELGKAEVKAKHLITSAKLQAQAITERPRAQVDQSASILRKSEARVQHLEEALFIALQIINQRIGKTLGNDSVD